MRHERSARFDMMAFAAKTPAIWLGFRMMSSVSFDRFPPLGHSQTGNARNYSPIRYFPHH